MCMNCSKKIYTTQYLITKRVCRIIMNDKLMQNRHTVHHFEKKGSIQMDRHFLRRLTGCRCPWISMEHYLSDCQLFLLTYFEQEYMEVTSHGKCRSFTNSKKNSYDFLEHTFSIYLQEIWKVAPFFHSPFILGVLDIDGSITLGMRKLPFPGFQ